MLDRLAAAESDGMVRVEPDVGLYLAGAAFIVAAFLNARRSQGEPARGGAGTASV